MLRIGIIGAGSYGSALAYSLGNQNKLVQIYDVNKLIIHEIKKYKTNSKYTKNIKFPDNVSATESIDELVKDKDFIILSIPSRFIRGICKDLKNRIEENTILINVSKGFDITNGDMINEIVTEQLPAVKYVTLSGPSHAEEIIKMMPTCLVAASTEIRYAQLVRDTFSSEFLRIYSSSDIKGVEIGGCIKNIIAIGAGVLDGLGYGDNTITALMIRSMQEIKYIGYLLGAQKETLNELSGIGDLIVTCSSIHSRNRQFGKLISEGYSIDDALIKIGQAVEGVSASQALYKRLGKELESLPIIYSIHQVINGKELNKDIVRQLMNRPFKDENTRV